MVLYRTLFKKVVLQRTIYSTFSINLKNNFLKMALYRTINTQSSLCMIKVFVVPWKRSSDWWSLFYMVPYRAFFKKRFYIAPKKALQLLWHQDLTTEESFWCYLEPYTTHSPSIWKTISPCKEQFKHANGSLSVLGST